MNAILPSQPHSIEELAQVSPSSQWRHNTAMAGPLPEQPKVFIIGDLRMCVTRSEAAFHHITGYYSIDTAGMREPLYLLWHAEGKLLSRRSRSTSITFDMSGARAGEIRTYLVAVQVVESGERGRAVQSGVFVQVAVTGDEPEAP